MTDFLRGAIRRGSRFVLHSAESFIASWRSNARSSSPNSLGFRYVLISGGPSIPNSETRFVHPNLCDLLDQAHHWYPVAEAVERSGFGQIEIKKLILDGILEFCSSDGPVYGSAALDVLGLDPIDVSRFSGNAALSIAALEYGASLEPPSSVHLSAKLYFYNRIGLSLSLRESYSTAEATMTYLTSLANKPSDIDWEYLSPKTDSPWHYWRSRWFSSDGDQSPRIKLYVCPTPSDLPQVFATVLNSIDASGALAFKVGANAHSLYRPDKLVVYFNTKNELLSYANTLAKMNSGCAAHRVPFTCELADGFLSWGADPVVAGNRSAIRERQSWRTFLCDVLASSICCSNMNSSASVPAWLLATQRAALEGIDPHTWGLSDAVLTKTLID